MTPPSRFVLPITFISAEGVIVIPVDMVPVVNPEGAIIGYEIPHDIETKAGMTGKEEQRIRFGRCDLVERTWS